MEHCVARDSGIDNPHTDGDVPGPFKVRRQAPTLRRVLTGPPPAADPMKVLDWVDQFAFAVNEVNAADGRDMTAPTNGASVVIVVLYQYGRFIEGASNAGAGVLLSTAGEIAYLYKENASDSGVEVGCQGTAWRVRWHAGAAGCGRRHSCCEDCLAR